MAFMYGGCVYFGGLQYGPGGVRLPVPMATRNLAPQLSDVSRSLVNRQAEEADSRSPCDEVKVTDSADVKDIKEEQTSPKLSFSIDSILSCSKKSAPPQLVIPGYLPSYLPGFYDNHYQAARLEVAAAQQREEVEDDIDVVSEDDGKTDATSETDMTSEQDGDAGSKYSWLNCTRYRPPKLPRIKRKDAKKRKLGRNPRVPFTQHQVNTLEDKFRRTHYLSSVDVAELSASLNLTETRVKIWFQNRRARERRDRENPAMKEGGGAKPGGSAELPGAPWPGLLAPPPAHALLQFSQALTQAGHSAFSPIGKYC